MTEEEKKAIETVDKIIKRMEENEKYLNKQKSYLEGLLADKINKIIKLQKENEELKEDNLGIREENIKLVNCHISYERYTGLDFLLPDKFKYAIPKDKIKEKIKELEQQKDLFFEKTIIQGRIDLLKELLEEE